MTANLTTASIRGILLDIEGTTTPISFVHDVLFSYARARLKDYLLATWDSAETLADGAALLAERAADEAQMLSPPAQVTGTREDEICSVAAYVNWLIDRDRKSTALKNLQGKIWQRGYADGTLRAELYEDVAPALVRWKQAGLSLNIFSSGSVFAQKLLFAHTVAGDVTHLIDNYFDTTTGAKTEAESYRRIAFALGLSAERVLFMSDVVAELDAAIVAGMKTVLCVRPGNVPQRRVEAHPIIHTFADVLN